MIKRFSKSKKKSTAQAMVEFALVLPILLLVVYGLIEAGRLIFIYATVVTAARQAVRYGSATGLNPSGTPYYQDCTGIRSAAKQVGFLNTFADADIIVTYDNGPSTASTGSCSGATSSVSIQNGDRVLVQVSTNYVPVVPLIVPFRPFTITSMSSRTLISSISIGVTSVGSGWTPSSMTATSSNTPTATATATNTLIPTPTSTSTTTSTPTATFTATSTPLGYITYTPSQTPTRTLTPTNTYTPTFTATSTNTATNVVCNLTHGTRTYSGNTMFMTITNNTGAVLQTSQVTVTWNQTNGHQTGADKTLKLTGASLGGSSWSNAGITTSPYTIPGFLPTIPTGTSTITFTFNQTYNNVGGSDNILIFISTNGCQSNPISG